MAQKLIATDGTTTKTINPWDTESYPDAWTFYGQAPVTQQMEQYARVAAVFGAYNLTADTIGNVRRVLYNKAGKEVDDTLDWQNVCGFLPNPSELYRLAAMSYIYSNQVYDIITTDGLRYKVKNVKHAIPDSFSPYISPSSGELEYIERRLASGGVEKYDQEGNLLSGEVSPMLLRMWRLDQSTEVLPSQHTEAKAIMSAAGIVYYADFWIQNFFRRGGIKPTLVAMKGLINQDTKEEAESSWSKFMKGIGQFTNRVVRIFNAEAMDIKPFGSGVDDMKDNKIYEQALENIAIGKRMPLSLLKANSANRATALEEKRTWFENYINPLCSWLDYEYNKQLWIPRGYRIKTISEFDDETEDEQERSDSIMKYMDIIEKSASFEVFMGVAEMMKIEIPERLEKALMQVFEDREKAKQEAEALNVNTDNPEDDPNDEEQPEEAVPAKWMPDIDQMNELRVWCEVATRRLKKGESVVFDYLPHHGGLPDAIVKDIQARLSEKRDWTPDLLKSVFSIARIVGDRTIQNAEGMLFAPQVKQVSEEELRIMEKLADAMNNLAESGHSVSHRESDKE